jgi:hypothetical protein
MPSFCLAALLVCLVASSAVAGTDPRLGTWKCQLGKTPYGSLTLSSTSYVFSGATGSGTGGLRWQGEAFEITNGGLFSEGATGGLVYEPPSQPGTFAVDVYSDMGTILTCHR